MESAGDLSEKLNQILIPEIRYVNESEIPGIKRIRKGKGWCYILPGGEICRDEQILKRIKRLAIPPAWKNVWICPFDEGHLQATGLDTKKRKQYRYHPLWIDLRSKDKYSRLLQFGLNLPTLRERVEHDLNCHGLPKRKVLALMIRLLENTAIRIGNDCYEKLYGSYGLTTLKDKHVVIKSTSVIFKFKGKKGVFQEIPLSEARLAKLVKKCKEIPGQELFQYYDDDGGHHCITSEDVNGYLKEVIREAFTAKDFRTWVGSAHALKVLLELGDFETKKQCKSNIQKAIEAVSKKLGNTLTVCKKYYIHPSVIQSYETKMLIDFLKTGEVKEISPLLAPHENLLMNLLETEKNNPGQQVILLK